LRIDANGQRYFSPPIELQINTAASTNAPARPKMLDLKENGGLFLFSLHNRLGPLDLIRGYNGSQIFDTTYATVDPAEPPHCASSNGISYWLAYQPPTNGLLTLDTLNSTYDTVMELYTYNGTLTGYSDLISLSCDDNSGGPGGAARLVTEVLP